VFGLLGKVDDETAFASLGNLLPHNKTRRNHGTCDSNLLYLYPGYLLVDNLLEPAWRSSHGKARSSGLWEISPIVSPEVNGVVGFSMIPY
jgi:hypothetical protein